MNIKQLTIFTIILVVSFAFFGSFVLAQEENSISGEPAVTVEQMVQQDESAVNEDLGVSEPTILPDSPIYFLKNFYRRIADIATFNDTKKMENRLQWANEKLAEIKKLSELKNNPQVLEKALEAYQSEVEKIKEISSKVSDENLNEAQKEKLNTFLDKLAKQQILHQTILGKLESQVPAEVFQKIQQVRERHLEKFGEVMNKLEKDPEKLKQRLKKGIQEIGGSQFKDLKILDVLKRLEQKAPESQQGLIEGLRNQIQERLKTNIQNLPEQGKQKFIDYLEKTNGDSENQLNTIQQLKIEEVVPLLKNRLMEKIKNQAESLKSKPKATPEKETVCTTLWEPVCGKDGKTYSNSCRAKQAGITVSYSGTCSSK
ncbi:MAG: DUF5667 domain-containing protein [bacterium]|nr:DUF5667 domain-containing protein [bacterium]